MTTAEYLKMVDEQIREAKDIMDISERAYIESKAKHEALIKAKEMYVNWVCGKPECKHVNQDRYNHGYHVVCRDCGVEL